MKKLLLCGSFAAITVVAAAQSKDVQIPNYGKVPYWIEMIKNPNVNYYEAVTAYEEFWKSRKNPLEENPLRKDEAQAGTPEKQTRDDKKEQILYLKYISECKKFERWKNSVSSYVQSDGRILAKTN